MNLSDFVHIVFDWLQIHSGGSLYNRYCVLRNALYCVEICSLSEAQLLQKVRSAFIGLSLVRPEAYIKSVR